MCEQEKERNGGQILPSLTVTELFVLFLESVDEEKSKSTFADYQRWCTVFAKQHGKRESRDITRHDAQNFKQYPLTTTWVCNNQPPRPYKPKSINHAIIAVRKAFNWDIDNELLAEGRNPFARLKLLPCQGRKRIATAEEYEALLRHCTDDHFRHVLIAMRYTQARPGDILNLTWPMVKWDRDLWFITEHKTTNTARVPKALIIGLNEEVRAMLQERLAKYGHKERVFLNEDGKPWTRNALGLRMRRLRKKAGIHANERGEEFVLYTNRHPFLSYAGEDPLISEAIRIEMAGHMDGKTTQIYTHLGYEKVAAAGRRVADAIRSQSESPGK